MLGHTAVSAIQASKIYFSVAALRSAGWVKSTDSDFCIKPVIT